MLVLVFVFTGIISCNPLTKEKNKTRSHKKYKKGSHKVKPLVKDFETDNFSPEGETLFIQYCSACHGPNGRKGLNGAKDLSQTSKEIDKIIQRINEGKGNMPAFKTQLNENQITEISKYVISLKTQ